MPIARPWSDRRVVSAAAQAAVVGVLIVLCYLVYRSASENLARQGIASGFDFLWRRAGFSITPHLIEYGPNWSFARALLVGVLNTLAVSAVAIALATLLGVAIGLARLSPHWLARNLALAYVETFRNLPLLLLVFFWYFGVLRSLPQPQESIAVFGLAFLNNRGLHVPAPADGDGLWVGAIALAAAAIIVINRRYRMHGLSSRWRDLALLAGAPLVAAWLAGFPARWEIPELAGFNFVGGVVLSPELTAIAAALAMYQASFIAETVRAGILSVHRGQVEAAQALGLKNGAVMRRVVLPQALKAMLPPLISIYLSTLKSSSLGAAIGYPELVSVFAGTTLSLVGQAIEIMAITLAIYLAIGLAVSAAMNLWDWQLRARETHGAF